MKLNYALESDLKKAIEENWPLVIPAGTVEYHGKHLGFGTDTLVVENVLEKLEKEKDLLIAPTFSYGPSSYAVAGPEKGTIDVDTDDLEQHIKDVLWGFLVAGFRNIYVVIHHQYEDGVENPEALAFKKAAKVLTFQYLEKEKGKGWWGKEENADFYETMDESKNPWNWIQVLPLMSPRVQDATGFDHAGEFETSLMLATAPEAVDMDRLDKPGQPWYVREADRASKEKGQRMVELILEDLRDVIA